MSPSEDKRFDSWKEIANFLGPDIRTVWRWEKERGLPVHRVPGEGRPSVFAFQSEIEAWLEGAQSLSNEGTSAKELALNDLSRARSKRILTWAICSLAVFSVAGLILHATGLWSRVLGHRATRIFRVSPIYATTNQGIIIDGKGFGPPPRTIRLTLDGGVDTYEDSYSTSMRIDNLGEGHHKWVAGRGGPLNFCAISLKLASWTDNRIVITGFAGPLGTSCTDRYQLAPGDKLLIIIWGPENRCGPGGPPQCPEEVREGRVATFETVVLPIESAEAPSCR